MMARSDPSLRVPSTGKRPDAAARHGELHLQIAVETLKEDFTGGRDRTASRRYRAAACSGWKSTTRCASRAAAPTNGAVPASEPLTAGETGLVFVNKITDGQFQGVCTWSKRAPAPAMLM